MIVKINNLEITISKTNIHIHNSYTITKKKDMKCILEKIKALTVKEKMNTPFKYRTINSMVREWTAHNNAYKLGYEVNRTAHVDLEYPQSWRMKLLYCIIGIIKL
jgi:hypothetical protein